MKQPLWAAVSVTESYRIVPPLAAMESVTLVAKPKGEGIEFKFDAKSKNGPAMADTVAMVNRGVGQAKTEMGRQIDSMPIAEMKQVMQSVVKMMDTIKCQADEKDAARGTLTGEIEMSPSSLIGSMLGSFGGFSERTGNAPDVIPNDVKDNK